MSRRHHLDHLRESSPLVLPSLLMCDFGNLEREVSRLEEAGVQALHLDVMDGRFVRNLTYGMPIVEALRRLTNLPLDAHLMIEEPWNYVSEFYDAGADIITVHVEACEDAPSVLRKIRSLGAGAGIALNPQTPLERISNCLDDCDLALVMSVEAGFGGQTFDEAALTKLSQLRDSVEPDVMPQVDGGIHAATIGQCAEAGAQLFVVGSAIFKFEDYAAAVTELTCLATNTS